MSQLEERLVARWSPYDLNAAAILAGAAMFAVIVASFALAPSFAVGIIVGPLILGAAGAGKWLMLIGLCPCCNKSPMRTQYGEGRLAELLRLRRAWPEQRCSACGCDLTTVPE